MFVLKQETATVGVCCQVPNTFAPGGPPWGDILVMGRNVKFVYYAYSQPSQQKVTEVNASGKAFVSTSP